MSRIRSVSALEAEARPIASRRAGCRLRHQPKGIHGRPDYANKARLTAVFVHGCWWHRCPAHFKAPKTNRKFWARKFARNVARHREVSRALRRRGWRVLTIWEHEVRGRKP
jgi:DNA mismatch endonuclease (patch repair protein)